MHEDPHEVSDSLIVKFDIFENLDEPTVVVERESGGSTHIINVVQGEDVLDVYTWLIGEGRY